MRSILSPFSTALILLFVCLAAPFYVKGQTDTTLLNPVVQNIEVFDPLKYPLKAIRKKIEGAVVVEVEVDSTGSYLAHNFRSSPGEILSNAIDPFIPQLVFVPAEKAGKKVAGLTEISVIFSIESRIPIRTEITFRFRKR